MPRKPPSPCPEPGCPALVDGGGRCPTHARPAWTGAHPTSTRHWRRTRARILRRDGWRCQLCGMPANEVDAIVPLAEDGSHDDDTNLRALCTPCHREKSAAEGHRARARKRGRGVG